MKKHRFLFILIFLTPSLHAQSNSNNSTEDGRTVAITVYNNDLGVVRDVRRFNIKDGTSEVRMVDVPSRIDPTTVKITDLDHPNDLDVLEQNYEYDLLNQDKLLQKYIDKSITLVSSSGKRMTGTVLAVDAGKLMLMTDSGIVSLSGLTGYTLSMSSIANGLYTKPTLIWELKSTRALTNEPLEVLYQTGGMKWHAEYIAALSDDEKSLDLSGWVSVENNSGASFPDAKLKLVAGSLNRVAPANQFFGSRGNTNALKMDVSTPFEEHGMFEYHIYDLGRQTTINNDEVKQISLLTANGVGAEKHYTYEGGKDVAVTISFQNSETNHLGIPLPMGVIRVMKRDNDGSLEFIGEDRIEHTPRDEKLTLHVGNAFDLVGDRQVTSSRTIGERESEETIEITLKNHKDEDATIDAVENLGADWEIISHSMDYEKKNANFIVFHVPVKSRGEQKVTYTVQHRW